MEGIGIHGVDDPLIYGSIMQGWLGDDFPKAMQALKLGDLDALIEVFKNAYIGAMHQQKMQKATYDIEVLSPEKRLEIGKKGLEKLGGSKKDDDYVRATDPGKLLKSLDEKRRTLDQYEVSN